MLSGLSAWPGDGRETGRLAAARDPLPPRRAELHISSARGDSGLAQGREAAGQPRRSNGRAAAAGSDSASPSLEPADRAPTRRGSGSAALSALWDGATRRSSQVLRNH
jgi:hypothetical protein